jgi:hypothetical protein
VNPSALTDALIAFFDEPDQRIPAWLGAFFVSF